MGCFITKLTYSKSLKSLKESRVEHPCRNGEGPWIFSLQSTTRESKKVHSRFRWQKTKFVVKSLQTFSAILAIAFFFPPATIHAPPSWTVPKKYAHFKLCLFSCLLTFICVFHLICTEFMFGNFYVKLLLRWLRFRNEWKRCASTNHLTIHLAIYPHTSALHEMHFRVKICKYDDGDDYDDDDISSSRNMGIFIGLWVLQCSTLVRKKWTISQITFFICIH